jgi:hypothetical protein
MNPIRILRRSEWPAAAVIVGNAHIIVVLIARNALGNSAVVV